MSPSGDQWSRAYERLREITHGEFEIQRELGRGGMAAVYLAHEIALNRRVAIKVMSPRLMADPALVTRFRQEAVTVAGLGHPNIVTIHAVRHTEDLDFFVMQFVEGRSLDRVIHAIGALSVPVVRSLLFMIGSALGYAHRRGVVHRDVKPGNVLLDADGNAIVTDFGIAKVAQDAGATQHLTQTGMLIGTPTYISPEQCYAQPVSAASDQYSLGIMAYELLTGHPPFMGSSFTVMQAHTQRPIPTLTDVRPDIPRDLEVALQRMLEKDPAKRWPTMQHALAALEAKPLAEHDPLRQELAGLALPDSMARSDQVLAIQITPSPDGEEPSPYVAGIAILAAPAEIQVGETITLGAAPRNAAGNTMPGARIVWSSDAPTVATVDPTLGIVRAIAPGIATITVKAEGLTESMQLRVVAKRAVDVTIVAPRAPLHVGDRIQLVVAPIDHQGEPVKERVRWSCATPNIASLSDDGTLVALAPGTAMVWAEVHGVRATAQLEVTSARVAALRLGVMPSVIEVGAQVSLGVTPLDAIARPLGDRPMIWLTTDPDVATVSSAGVVTGITPGTVLVTCTCEDETVTHDLTVVPVSIAAVRIDRPDGARLGETFRIEAEALSAHGRHVPAEFTYHSTAPDVATVDDRGVVTPLALGEVTIIARTEGAQGMVSFFVTADAAKLKWRPRGRRALRRNVVAGVVGSGVVALAIAVALATSDSPAVEEQAGTVDPPPVQAPVAPVVPERQLVGMPSVIVPGDSFTLRAVGIQPELWRSSAPTIATVDSITGAVSALAPGAVEMLAIAGADSLRQTLTVAVPAGMMIRIARQTPMQVGDTRRLALEVTPRSIRPPAATWESRAPTVLEVGRTSGRARALSEGSVMVIATYEGGIDSVFVTVQGIAIASIDLSPSRVQLVTGDTARVAARIIDARSGVVGNRSVAWSSADRNIASVSAEGLITAHAPGTIPITARIGEITSDVVVDVREARSAVLRRMRERAQEFTDAVRTLDSARVRQLFASNDDAGLRALLEAMGRRDVRLREVGRSDPSFTDSTATLDVRIQSSTPRLIGRTERVGVFRVRFAPQDGTWRPIGVTMTSGFR